MNIDERVTWSQVVFVGKVRRVFFVTSRMSELPVEDANRGTPILEVEVSEVLFTKRDPLPSIVLWSGGIALPGPRADWNNSYKDATLIFFAGTLHPVDFKGEARLLATFPDLDSARPLPVTQLGDVMAAVKKREEQR